MQAWEEKYYEREEGREEGLKEGFTAGEMQTKKIFKLHMLGKTMEEIAAECGLPVEKVQSVLE